MSDVQTVWPATKSRGPLAILCSGGIDSAILVAEALSLYPAVHPLYVHTGMRWEDAELAHLRRFLAAIQTPSLQMLTVFNEPIREIYGDHWSVTGRDVPDENSTDMAVYLPGRNILLLSKTLIWCHLNKVPEIALALLAANPFPDATPEFFTAFSAAVSMAVEDHISVLRPYARSMKKDVIKRARGIPLEHTFSCIWPINGGHCGQCNKCAERRKGFIEANTVDPTVYAIS